MVTRLSSKALWVLWVTIFSAILTVTPAAAAASSAPLLASGQAACSEIELGAFQAGCGDGICDAYMGEDASTCPQDCVPSVVNTPVSVATRTPTATLPSSATARLSSSATATLPSSATATATIQETLAGSIETSAPVEITATPPAGDVLILPGCDLVPYESRAQAWQKGYGGQASPGSFVPLRSDDREVYVCTVPPVGQVCIPIYQGLVKASQEDIRNIVLVDCATNGSCNVYLGPGKQVGETICFDASQSDHLSCSAGCALAPRPESAFMLPLLGNVPTRILAPTACLAALVIFGLVLGIIFVSRRSRGRALPSTGASQPPYGWDSIPTSPGTPTKGAPDKTD
jgi:hypothetical protein